MLLDRAHLAGAVVRGSPPGQPGANQRRLAPLCDGAVGVEDAKHPGRSRAERGVIDDNVLREKEKSRKAKSGTGK